MLTSQIGNNYFRFGNIIFGGINGPSKIDFQVHVLTAKKVRIKFNSKMNDTAIDINNYVLSTVMLSTFVPGIESIEFYDETQRSIVINLDASLTTTKTYSITLSNVYDINGESLLNASLDFIANVYDPPIAIGAWQSKNGFIDILFDKSVGPTSSGAAFFIRDASVVAPSFAMTQALWAGEIIPENTLRVQLPITTPTANAYEIDFSLVEDQSLNSASGTIPVTLALRAPLPYDFAKLNQLQLTDAYVVDVNRGFYNITTVRVFFNGPTRFNNSFDNASNVANWSVYQEGPHITADTNQIVSPDAVLVPSLITLVNELLTKFNLHIANTLFHNFVDTINTITSPAAFDLNSAIVVLNEMQPKYNAHLWMEGLHKYEDTMHTVQEFVIDPGNLSFADSVANRLKAKYNLHIAAEFLVNFQPYHNSVNLAEIGNSSYLNAIDVESPYTYVCELHVVSTTINAQFRIEATIVSWDTLSTTNPADYTGSIAVRQLDNNQISSIKASPDGFIDINFDKEVLLPALNCINLTLNNQKIPIEDVLLSATPLSAIWAFNNFLIDVTWHAQPGTGAIHQVYDPLYLIPYFIVNYRSAYLSLFITNVNAVKQLLITHMISDIFHFHSDMDIPRTPDATDFDSAVALINDMRRIYMNHNQKIGPHTGPGYNMISSPLFNRIKLKVGKIKDGSNYEISGDLEHQYYILGLSVDVNARLPKEIVTNSFNFQSEFIGLSTKPSLASALPKLALEDTDSGAVLRSDVFELFFSKPMTPTDLNNGDVQILGGGIIQKEARWVTNQVASVQVSNTSQIPYTVTVVNLTDESGNPIY